MFLLQGKIFAQKFDCERTDTLFNVDDYTLRQYDVYRDINKKCKSTIHKLNIKKEITKHEIFLPNKKYSSFQDTVYYDPNGLVVKRSWINKDKFYNRVYKYDKWDNCIEDCLIDKNNNIIEKTVRKFDSYGNFIYYMNSAKKELLTNKILFDGSIVIYELDNQKRIFKFNRSGLLLAIYYQSSIPSPRRQSWQNGHSQFLDGSIKFDTTFVDYLGKSSRIDSFIYNQNFKISKVVTKVSCNERHMTISRTRLKGKEIQVDTAFKFNKGGSLQKYTFIYDKNQISQLIDSSEIKKNEIYKTIFNYDTDNRLINKMLYNFNDNKLSQLAEFIIKYDINGNIILKKYIDRDMLVWERGSYYNSKNKIVKSYFVKQTDTVEVQNYSYYNSLNISQIENISFYDCSDCDEEDTIYKKTFPHRELRIFNTNGNVLEQLSFENGNKLIEKITFEYNELGNNTKTIRYNSKGIAITERLCTYDSHGANISSIFREFTKNKSEYSNTKYEFYK